MNRIAVFLPNWIGDVVMATPAVRALRDHFPAAELTAVCKGYVADTLGGCPWFDRTVLFDKGGPKYRRAWGVIRRLRAEPIDAAVLFPNSFRAAAVAKLGGCSRLYGFARYGRDALLTKRLYPVRGVDGRPKPVPAIDDYNRVVRLVGVPDPGHRMELFTTPLDEATADEAWLRLRLGRYRTVVGLNPGGAFGSSKHWPTPYFADLARTLADRGNGVVILCGPAERDTAAEIARLADRPAVVSLADSPLSIGLTKAVVRRLSLLVTTDSGPRHFAAAFSVPVVTLFGPTHIGWTETYFDRAVHMQKPVPCGPCQLRTCPLDHRCMTTLLPAEVLAAADRLLLPAATDGPPRQERRHAG
jgi:heptosyltransferase-2